MKYKEIVLNKIENINIILNILKNGLELNKIKNRDEILFNLIRVIELINEIENFINKEEGNIPYN